MFLEEFHVHHTNIEIGQLASISCLCINDELLTCLLNIRNNLHEHRRHYFIHQYKYELFILNHDAICTR